MALLIPEISLQLLVNETAQYLLLKDARTTDVETALAGVSKAAVRTKEKEMKRMGKEVGKRIVESHSREHIWLRDQKELLRYICKDFWTYIFGKPIDRLQTNNKGIYLLHDNNLKWVKSLSSTQGDAQLKFATLIMGFIRGLVKGALSALGVDGKVTANSDQNFTTFNITLPTQQG
jgi:hypothetical protein